jgi:ribosomal protein L37AE/L43A
MIGTCNSCQSDTHVSQHPLGVLACRNCYLSVSEVSKQNKIAGGMVVDSVDTGWTTVNGDKHDQR